MDRAKTVFVTAGSSLIGRSILSVFLQNGYTVVTTTRSSDKLPNQLIENPNLFVHNLDLTNDDDINRTIRHIIDKHNSFDAVINNAGIVLSGPFESSSSSQVKKHMQINFFAVTEVIRSFIPLFKKQGYGSIINVSSISGAVTFPLFSVYHATKWALEGFSESLWFELNPFNIKVKLIQSGGVLREEGDVTVELVENPPSEYDDIMNLIHHTSWYPSFSEPSDVAQSVYLASTDLTDRLRYQVGDDCGVFVKERLNNLTEEEYLKLMQLRITNG